MPVIRKYSEGFGRQLRGGDEVQHIKHLGDGVISYTLGPWARVRYHGDWKHSVWERLSALEPLFGDPCSLDRKLGRTYG